MRTTIGINGLCSTAKIDFTSTTMHRQPSDSTLLGRFLLLRSKRHLRRCSKPTRLIFFHPLFGHDQPQLFRSLFGFAFPLFGQPMFDKLGLGGGNSVSFFFLFFFFCVIKKKQLLAGIAIVIGIPFPIWIYYKGEELRARNPLTKMSTIPKRIVLSES